MWIIPKNLKTKNSHIYHYAQDTEALTLDCKELSKMCVQSLLWRSKPSQSATWLRRWKTDLLNQHLFGRILKPFLGKCLIEKWISCQVASLVNHSVRQVEEKGTKTKDTCFPTSRKEYENVDLPLFSWKMLKESCPASSKDKIGPTLSTHQFCYTSLESWKDWVTKQRRDYSQRARQVHHINVNESSFLVSVMNSPNQALIMSPNLSQEASQERQLTQQEGDKINIGLNLQELRWATPSVRDQKDSGLLKERSPRKDGKPRIDSVPIQVFTQQGYRGKLNPRWVEMLMGLPIGWTVPTCTNPVIIEPMNLECWEMGLYPTQQEPPSSECGGSWSTPRIGGKENVENWIKRQEKWKQEGISFSCPLDVQVQIEQKLVKSEDENWSTPPASQRGEGLEHYLNRMKSRFKRGFEDAFAPTLQIQVEAEEKGVNIKSELNNIKMTLDHEP